MRRGLSAVAAPLLLGGGFVGLAAVPAQAAANAYTVADNNATVCMALRGTVATGGKKFKASLEGVGSQAAKGDVRAADQAVQKAGGNLVAFGGDLRTDANRADDPSLKAAVNNLATQLETAGKKLDSLSSLQSFDAGQLRAASDRVAKMCGASIGPSTGRSPGR